MKIVVTAGSKGADIDVFACAVAYAELLRLEGHDAVAVIEGQFTSSATPSLLGLTSEYTKEYVSDGSEEFVLVDISDPEHFAQCVDPTRIREVYDHRSGHEVYWERLLGSDAHIEMVGACGTLIWEEFKKRGKSKDISRSSAELLVGSIVSNTLVFLSPQTTDRDKKACSELKDIAELREDWIKKYFKEQEVALLDNFKNYVKADTKKFTSKWGPFAIGQIEMWDASTILETHKQEIDSIMEEFKDIPWIVNVVNISKGFNYIYSKSDRGKEIVEKHADVDFRGGNIAETSQLVMRKYLMKRLIQEQI